MFIAAIFTKFSQLIVRKITKIVATILRLKCTNRFPDPLSGFMGPTSKVRGGRGEEGRNGKGTHLGLDPVPLLFLRIYPHVYICCIITVLYRSFVV